MKYSIYSGAGNDFVMIDNRESTFSFESEKELTVKICRDNFKGIDGAIFLERPIRQNALIRMNYYNRDGSYGAMCGNGARCIARYAVDEGIVSSNEFNIEAVKKIYRAELLGNSRVKIYFPPPAGYRLNIRLIAELEVLEKTQDKNDILNLHWFQVGSEHLVLFIDERTNKRTLGARNLDEVRVDKWGRALRYHKDFQPEGANVNFAQTISANELRIRTYERGVERETLACGTGIIAAAIASNLINNSKPPVKVLVQSGEWLTVDFRTNGVEIEALSLEGTARKVSEGEIQA